MIRETEMFRLIAGLKAGRVEVLPPGRGDHDEPVVVVTVQHQLRGAGPCEALAGYGPRALFPMLLAKGNRVGSKDAPGADLELVAWGDQLLEELGDRGTATKLSAIWSQQPGEWGEISRGRRRIAPKQRL